VTGDCLPEARVRVGGADRAGRIEKRFWARSLVKAMSPGLVRHYALVVPTAQPATSLRPQLDFLMSTFRRDVTGHSEAFFRCPARLV